MRLLIDGYNLLHVTDLFGKGDKAGTLAGSREALIAFLVVHLPDKLRPVTTIVFDAAGAPPGLPDRYSRDGMQVRFARGYAEADLLLELVIEQHRAPKSLLVVSSDHRVQRAARSRGADYSDSETWFSHLRQRRTGRSDDAIDLSGAVMSVDFWVREFEEHVGEIVWSSSEVSNTPPTSSPSDPPATDKNESRLGEIFPTDYLDQMRAEFGEDI